MFLTFRPSSFFCVLSLWPALFSGWVFLFFFRLFRLFVVSCVSFVLLLLSVPFFVCLFVSFCFALFWFVCLILIWFLFVHVLYGLSRFALFYAVLFCLVWFFCFCVAVILISFVLVWGFCFCLCAGLSTCCFMLFCWFLLLLFCFGSVRFILLFTISDDFSMFSDKKRGTLLSGFLPQIMKDDMLCTFCKDHIGILDQDLYRDEVRLGAVCDSIRIVMA